MACERSKFRKNSLDQVGIRVVEEDSGCEE
jgi:hypothetical protein